MFYPWAMTGQASSSSYGFPFNRVPVLVGFQLTEARSTVPCSVQTFHEVGEHIFDKRDCLYDLVVLSQGFLLDYWHVFA